MNAQPHMQVLPTTGAAEWTALLERCRQHDFHHLPEYHRVAERRGEGEGRLFAYGEDGYTIAIPLLLRAIQADQPDGWRDATSVYGYGGPVASHDEMPAAVIANFHAALRGSLMAERVVSLFSRLHPQIEQAPLLAELGEAVANGTTVSIDLTLSEEEQRAGYNKSCRTSIRKLTEAGFVGHHDVEKRYLAEFVEVYTETMRRAGALSSYLFDEDYFRLLTGELGEKSHLFVALKDGQVAAATLCTLCDGIVQDHLGGTRDAYLKYSPDRLVVHTERMWAKAAGARVFHLGGGIGAQEDSLFRYKAGFSPRRHVFRTWRWILQPEIYAELTRARQLADAAQNLRPVSEHYFPAYRCPALPADAEGPKRRETASGPALRVIGSGEAEAWHDVVRGAMQHDFYFLPGYHALAGQRETGEAQLFVYTHGRHTLALPLVIRRIDADSPWHDATSVYGYAGPLASQADTPAEVVAGFQQALAEALTARKVVAVFSRLHPLMRQRDLLSGLGELCSQGETVSIDLTAPLETQRANYSATVKTKLNRLRRNGFSANVDGEKRHLDEFIAIYHETMRRVGAAPAYFFAREYFTGLAEALGETLELLLVKGPDGRVVSAGLFTRCDGIVQYHLGGTRTEALPHSPMALLLDAARLRAQEHGARVLHLGGGVGARADSLFEFKAKLSPERNQFATWRWILNEAVYEKLAADHARALLLEDREPAPGFFPAYRAPGRPLQPTEPGELLSTHG
jgi:lipid II:glycine glycyltransferase (peptidoglycan interpeptide bridge formation enzyme)